MQLFGVLNESAVSWYKTNILSFRKNITEHLQWHASADDEKLFKFLKEDIVGMAVEFAHDVKAVENQFRFALKPNTGAVVGIVRDVVSFEKEEKNSVAKFRLLVDLKGLSMAWVSQKGRKIMKQASTLCVGGMGSLRQQDCMNHVGVGTVGKYVGMDECMFAPKQSHWKVDHSTGAAKEVVCDQIRRVDGKLQCFVPVWLL